MIKEKLTEHFAWNELCVNTRIWGKQMPNEPTEETARALRALAENVLEPIRDILGVPMIITSGFRTKQNNYLVGGVVNSQHIKGQAADFYAKGISAVGTLKKIVDSDTFVDFDQLICYRYKGFIHVSYKADGGNRHEILYK